MRRFDLYKYHQRKMERQRVFSARSFWVYNKVGGWSKALSRSNKLKKGYVERVEVKKEEKNEQKVINAALLGLGTVGTGVYKVLKCSRRIWKIRLGPGWRLKRSWSGI